VSDDHRVPSPDLFQNFYKEGGLGAWSPDTGARPLGMSESGTIKAQDTIAPGKKINKAADGEILNHRSIAVEKNDARGSRVSPLPIVHADPLALDELPRRRIFSFRYHREHKVPDDQEKQDNNKNDEDDCDCGHIYRALESTDPVNIMSRHLLQVEEPIHQLTGLGPALFLYAWAFRAKKNPPSGLRRALGGSSRGWQIAGGWLVGGSTLSTAAYRDQSQNPLTACVPLRTCGLPNGASRLSLAEDRRKLFLPRVRAVLPSCVSTWPCEEDAEIGGAGVIASPSLEALEG
jgi:hypothetical protein